MNLYRGCQHNCAYCDGRAEGYYVEGEFGRDVGVKINAPEILKRELDPSRRRKPLKGGYFFLGGGVGDSYQPVEEKYRLSRQALEILAGFDYPVQVLTKSTLVRRDLDLLQQINRQRRALVCFSISSANEQISRIFFLPTGKSIEGTAGGRPRRSITGACTSAFGRSPPSTRFPSVCPLSCTAICSTIETGRW